MIALVPDPAVTRLWRELRLVVLDIETAVAPDGTHRIVSIALVSCRDGSVRHRWQQLVDPGVPIDPETHAIHGLTDAHVAGEPTFEELVPQVFSRIVASDGQRVVLCAHNIRFDVPVLRAELGRIGMDLPDLPLLDTAGSLPRLAGVRPDTRRLADLLKAVGLANAAPHEALSDAAATAEAACELLRRAALAGHDDLTALLALTGDATAHKVEFSGPKRRTRERATRPVLPDDHLATHSKVLPRQPAARTLAAWNTAAAACVRLRCDFLTDRISQTQAPVALILPPLLDLLRERARAGDGPGAATLLGGLDPLLRAFPPLLGRGGRRRAVIAFHQEAGPLLDPLPRCRESDSCPNCARGFPCHLDLWRQALAEGVVGEIGDGVASGFIETNGRRAGTGAYDGLVRSGHRPLADVALRLVATYWRKKGQTVRADQLAGLAWRTGCRDPQIVEWHAMSLAAGGRDADLLAALAVIEPTLALRSGSTDVAWDSLAVRKLLIEGRLERRRVRESGELDADGKPVPVRRHTPASPRRIWPARFLRGE